MEPWSKQGYRRFAHLDRALCDASWRHLFSAALVRHLPHSHGDHCPLLLELEEVGRERLGARPFKFEAAWALLEEFDDWLRREWNINTNLPTTLKDLVAKLRAWNQDTFGNIFRRKKRNELRLGVMQRAMARSGSNYLLNLERELRKERSLILLQEEMLWLQKSRIEWLKSGDSNTRFFHTYTVIRRRRN